MFKSITLVTGRVWLVADEPTKPKNVEVVDWDKDHADLKWIKPDNDGGAPITGYIIEFKEKFGKDWEKGKEISGDVTEATIDGLKEGTQYEFRIRAVNKAGPGEPSDATKPIIAKSRFGKIFTRFSYLLVNSKFGAINENVCVFVHSKALFDR